MFILFNSVSLPEKLEYVTQKYAEHSHDKWSAEKVGITVNVLPNIQHVLVIPGNQTSSASF